MLTKIKIIRAKHIFCIGTCAIIKFQSMFKSCFEFHTISKQRNQIIIHDWIRIKLSFIQMGIMCVSIGKINKIFKCCPFHQLLIGNNSKKWWLAWKRIPLIRRKKEELVENVSFFCRIFLIYIFKMFAFKVSQKEHKLLLIIFNTSIRHLTYPTHVSNDTQQKWKVFILYQR